MRRLRGLVGPAASRSQAMAEPAAAPLRRAFVTGGSGFVGRNLIRRLRADGVSVAALARSEAARRTVEDAGAQAVMVRCSARPNSFTAFSDLLTRHGFFCRATCTTRLR
jgi:nucleoside-diphosphate-sugar epimerase